MRGLPVPPERAEVLVVGGGPCGLVLAIELGRRGIAALLVDAAPGTAVNPQANATQARTMEHYRRLGFAEEIRALGLPPDHPTDIAYSTRFAGHELARFALPSAREARLRVAGLNGSWSAAELPHRVSQKFVEPVLRRHAEASGARVHYGWRLTGFAEGAGEVAAELERVADGARRSVRAAFLVGADGARSLVRRSLGIRHMGEAGVARDFMGGRMYAIHLRCPDFRAAVPHAPAWMHVAYNRDRRAFMAAVDGQAEYAFHTQLREGEDEAAITAAEALAMFQRAAGLPLDAEILARQAWTAGHALVAERFRQGRVLIAGDAAHLFTPAGGLGYNTAVEDAVNLGWKLAALLRGQGGPALLDSYEAERLPLARRNTGFARRFAEGLAHVPAPPELEAEGPEGEAARARAGAHFAAHGRAEFNIPGVTFGGRYDASPVIAGDGTAPPPDAADRYVPSGCPGGRPPHLWLAPGVSLFDRFGPDWTLLRLGPRRGFRPASGEGFAREAAAAGIRLAVVDVPGEEARELYGRDLALVRPDQILAWRGDTEEGAAAVLARVTGRAAAG